MAKDKKPIGQIVEAPKPTPKAPVAAPVVDKVAYEKAFKDITAKIGITPESLDRIAKQRATVLEQVEYEIPYHCKINGKRYAKKGIASRGEVEMLVSMAGNKRMRLIREKVSHQYEVEMLATGQIRSRLLKATDAAGTEVGSV